MGAECGEDGAGGVHRIGRLSHSDADRKSGLVQIVGKHFSEQQGIGTSSLIISLTAISMGLTELMSNVQPVGPNRWRADIFVPDRNLRAEGDLRLAGPRTLAVRGCAIGGLLCRSQDWTRVASAKKRRR